MGVFKGDSCSEIKICRIRHEEHKSLQGQAERLLPGGLFFYKGNDPVDSKGLDQQPGEGTQGDLISGKDSAYGHNQNICDQQGFSNLDPEIFFYNEGDDICSAGAGVHAEHDAACNGNHGRSDDS